MRALLAAVASVTTLMLTACGGSESSSTTAVPPAAYVRSVCRAMVQWNEGVAAAYLATEGQTDTNQSASIRRGMLDFFDAIQDRTDAMRARIAKAGSPNVPDGIGVARELRASLTSASAKLKANRASFAAVPLSDVQPAASIEGAMTGFGEQYEAVYKSVERLDEQSPDLRQARQREPACNEFRDQR